MVRSFERLRELRLAALDGQIGKVRDMYFDDHSWRVRYFAVATGLWLAEREVLIAPRTLGQIDEREFTIATHLTRDEVRHSPPVEPGETVTRRYEELYHQYYGWNPYWTAMSVAPGILEQSPDLLPVDIPRKTPSESSPALTDTSYLRSCRQICGYTLHAQDGEIGHVEDFLVDDQDWLIRYLIVGTGRWFTGKEVLLEPFWVERISFDESEVFVNLSRSQIIEAPEYDARVPITGDVEQRLHDHYSRNG